MAVMKHGKTSIHMKYSPVNQAWLVWREDSGYQALVEIFNTIEDARCEYKNRVEFFLQIARA